MKKLYLVFICLILYIPVLTAQDCDNLTAICTTTESRCAATGSINVSATGGSGNYKYRALGPVNTNFTSSDAITGLSAGTYTVIVQDIISQCIITITGVVVPGNYQDPRFTLIKNDVSCDNGNNGSITVDDPQFGLAPFTYTIVSPSASGVGTSNSTGHFPGLIAGEYGIQMTDSCGGIQTRRITVNNYTWYIDLYSFVRTGCDSATGYIKVRDSKGNISTVGGIPGFQYGIVISPGDTTWSTNPNFEFALNGNLVFDVVVKDNCGKVKKATAALNLHPSLGANVSQTNKLCNSFTATLTSISNFFEGEYCLYNSADVLISCNETGVFTNLSYGTYCIKATDNCIDTVIVRCFTATPPPISLGASVSIINRNCSTFTAQITSPVGITNPEYCLLDENGAQIICNNNGTFTGLAYGNYCIRMTDGCIDTIITRCFTTVRPVPVVHPVTPSYSNCNNFGIVVTGDSLGLPTYCLYDENHVLIICNTTGVFDSIPLGNYCVEVTDACYDTTIVRCFTVGSPVITNSLSYNITKRTCTGFTVTATASTFTNPQFCVTTSAGVLVGCNSTGSFVLPYGDYCITARNNCPDTTFTTCFSVLKTTPSADANVETEAADCNTFAASVTGTTGFFDPQFCLYDEFDNFIACNNNGRFENLLYGKYCIRINDNCADTIITRCFTRNMDPVNISATSVKSCNYGFAKFSINTGIMYYPVTVKIYRPDGSLFSTNSYFSNPVVIDHIPGVPVGQFYNIIASDNCGRSDTLQISALASYFNKSTSVVARCPGGTWVSGSGNIEHTLSTNMGSGTIRIIKKNGVTYSPLLTPSSVSGQVYKFNDLGPGTYIIRSSESTCNIYLYDTVIVKPYEYPNLERSSAYQCDTDGFSVGAVVSNGVGPFMYEIIGSTPSTPSIIAGPQLSPVFNINNGTSYSLVRLRAVDACGNASLGDASILPLANNYITVTDNCLFDVNTLSVDSVTNSTYTWYKKTAMYSIDSVLMGTGSTLYIPYLTPADTGVYVCHISVNEGCIKRSYYFNLDGSCHQVLPTILESFTGKALVNRNRLFWKTQQEENLEKFIVQRKNLSNSFIDIGFINAGNNRTTPADYTFDDDAPEAEWHEYRLKLRSTNGNETYSNIVRLGGELTMFDVYPNPVKDKIIINLNAKREHSFLISISNIQGQMVYTKEIKELPLTYEITRPHRIVSGVYLLTVINKNTGMKYVRKLMFH